MDVPVQITANKKTLTIANASVKSKVYDATTAATVTGATLDGVVENDDVSLVIGTATFADAYVDKAKKVTVTGSKLSGDDAANYTLTEVSGLTGDIAQASVKITAESAKKTYGDKDPSFTYKVTELIGKDTLAGKLSRAAGEDAGEYAIALGTLSAGDNYTVDFTSAKLTIAKAEGNGSVTIAGWTLGEKASTPVAKSETNGTEKVKFEYKGKDADSYSDKVLTKAVKYTVRATFAATKNYTEAVATADFTVKEKKAGIANAPRFAAANVRAENSLIAEENAGNARVIVMNALGKTLYIGRGDATVNVANGLYIVTVGRNVTRVCVK